MTVERGCACVRGVSRPFLVSERNVVAAAVFSRSFSRVVFGRRGAFRFERKNRKTNEDDSFRATTPRVL